MYSFRNAAKEERGAAAVEFALLLPLLILLLFGIIEFSRAYNAQISLQHAVREGVRVHALQAEHPTTWTRDAAPSLVPRTAIDVSVDGAPLAESDPPPACNPADPTTVRATYPFTYTIPLFGMGTVSLSAEGVMRCGG